MGRTSTHASSPGSNGTGVSTRTLLWLNLVERWFRDLAQKRLCRSSFHHVRELVAAILDYIHDNNQNPKYSFWSASAESIMSKIIKC